MLFGQPVSGAIGAVIIALIAFVAGILKEVYDVLVKKSVAEILDALFTWLGAVPILLVWFEIVILLSR